MTLAGACTQFRRQLRHFARDRSAVSALEFAIVLPFMLLLYIGSVELGDGLAIQFRVTEAARTVVSVASEYTSLDTSTMSSILGAASTVVAPYPATNMTVTLSEVTTDANSNATVTWSCSLNGTAHTGGAAVTLPSGMQQPSVSLLWGEVSYPYAPQLGFVITGTINIYQSSYFYPRVTGSVGLPSGC